MRAKSTPTDPVTVVDTETERLLRDRLAELRPGEPIVGEEEGGSARRPGRPTWVLDPIDGTVNFVYGIEAYAVSVGVQVDGRSVAGAVANVATGEVFSAALGQGARLRRGGDVDAVALHADHGALDGAGRHGVRLRAASAGRQQAEVLARLLPEVRDVRRVGSCALDLCMVAAGRLDALLRGRACNVWDWAAGALIAAEAGAVLRLPPADGGARGLIVAAAPGIAAEFDAALRRGRRDDAVNAAVSRLREWIFFSSAESAGCVASGRRLASTASMSSLWLSSENSVPMARSTVSSPRWSWYSSVHGATSHSAAAAARPAGPNRIWPWHSQPVARVDVVVGRVGRGVPEVSQRARDLGGLPALAAGVEHADLGVGELGGHDVGHGGTRHR